MEKFISHAQNFEDVMLWRALKHIENGFYIDIGAAWPSIDSVTKSFYDVGWSGINIEPNPHLYKQLEKIRKRDLNLNLAVSNKAGEIELNIVENTGLSTLDQNIAETHKKSGFRIIKWRTKVSSLSNIWLENIDINQPVHFLKIDVEGFEKNVIEGNDWTTNRPWIIVVEATTPQSKIETHWSWEPTLISRDYIFSYADGLNRFYVAKEHCSLVKFFNYPPNVFDDFLINSKRCAKHDRKTYKIINSIKKLLGWFDKTKKQPTPKGTHVE